MEKAFDYLLQIAMAAMLLLLAWLRRADGEKIKTLEADIKAAHDSADAASAAAASAEKSAVRLAFEAGAALADHKLYAAETFARKADVETIVDKAETRIRSEMTKNQEAQLDRLEEIRDRLPSRN